MTTEVVVDETVRSAELILEPDGSGSVEALNGGFEAQRLLDDLLYLRMIRPQSLPCAWATQDQQHSVKEMICGGLVTCYQQFQ